MSTPEPTTYFALAQRPGDDAAPTVTGASAKPYGADLPAPSYGSDPAGTEPPLGQNVNALPDMETCWWRDGAKPPRKKSQANDDDT